MKTLKSLTQEKFILVILNNEQYIDKLYKTIKSIEKTKNKICYICLSRPYRYVLNDLKKSGLNPNSFFFIDCLSGYYKKPGHVRNCLFLDLPINLESIKKAIDKVVKKEKCSVLLFDTISTMLIYQESFCILKFTHSLIVEKKEENVKKIFIVLEKDTVPQKESKELTADLSMMADKTLELI